MAPLSIFPLPLPSNGPPAGYGWEARDMSTSTTTSLDIGIDTRPRDTFLGRPRCVICGAGGSHAVQHCYITKESEPDEL